MAFKGWAAQVGLAEECGPNSTASDYYDIKCYWNDCTCNKKLLGPLTVTFLLIALLSTFLNKLKGAEYHTDCSWPGAYFFYAMGHKNAWVCPWDSSINVNPIL